MESLNISGASLQTFPEIQNLSYESVDASWNGIRALWEEELPAGIKTLNLEGNQIGSDGLLQVWPNSLETLNLSQNQIMSLRDVMHWPTSLRVLNLSYNQFEGVLNCRHFPPSLEELDISFTNIISIVEFPPNLKVFTAISTCLQQLPSKCPDSLVKCTVSNTRSLKKNGLPNYWGAALEHLELYNCRLREFPRNLPATLKFLNLSKNRIERICAQDKFPPNLSTILLGNNRIFEIPIWFSRMWKMKYTIHNNLLTTIPTAPNCLIAVPQLVGARFQNAAERIQKRWRAYKMGSPFRSWYRISFIKDELIAVAMCPERAGKYEDISPEWGYVYTLGK
jgi:Leucine-rich repeat (LRR) protein